MSQLKVDSITDEAGTGASFERGAIGTEVALCQRYFEVVNIARCTGITFTSNGDTRGGGGTFKVTKREFPSISFSGSLNVISTGNVSTQTNVNPGTPTFVPYGLNKFEMVSLSNPSVLQPAGGTVVWEDNAGGGLTIRADAEL